MKENLVGKHSLEKLLLYRERKAEHEEILRHKWLESEKAGHDVGFDLAMTDWNLKHRAEWLRARPSRYLTFTFQI